MVELANCHSEEPVLCHSEERSDEESLFLG